MVAQVTVVTLLLGLTGVVLGLLLLALLTPIRFALRGVFTDERLDASAVASWYLGALGVRASWAEGAVLELFGRPVYRLARGRSEKRSEERPRRTRRASWRPGWRLVRRVASSLRLRVRVLGRLGLGDPADTAALYGLVAAARSVLRGLDVSALRIEWMEPTVDLEGRLDGRVWPAAIVWIVASEYVRSRGSRRAGEVTP